MDKRLYGEADIDDRDETLDAREKGREGQGQDTGNKETREQEEE